MDVAFLADPAAQDAARFGAKAATLARVAASHRVPPGFALAADLAERLGAAHTATALRLRVLIAPAYAELGQGRAVPVAVRSSAIGEDGGETSFAGQHETILGVVGLDAVVEAVLDVWRSATSERAMAYRREHGIEGAPRVGVLVQRLIDADASLIAFTADPVSGESSEVVINSSWGLGECIASGAVTPDTFTVTKADLRIGARSLADKDVMTVRTDRGVEERAVPRSKRRAPSLTDEQVGEVARLAMALEAETGRPVDIEGAVAGGEIWLLQARPITAARGADDEFPLEWPEPEDADITWRREDAHFSGAKPPLEIDYVRYGPSTGIQRRNKAFGLPIHARFEEFNAYIYVGSRPLAPPDEMAAHQKRAAEKRAAHGRRLVRDWPERYFPKAQEHFAWMGLLRPGEMSPAEAADAWDELWRRINETWEIHMLITGGAYPLMDELASTYEQLTGRPGSEAFALTAGRAKTLQQLQRDMFVLTEVARSQPRIADAIRGGVEALDVLRDLPGGARFTEAVATFQSKHGNVGQASESITAAAWGDDSALVVREVRRQLEVPPVDPEARHAKLLTQGEETLARTRELLRSRPDDLARFEEVAKVAHEVGPLTEEHNYWIDRWVQAHVRRAVLAFGARMVADGTLERAEDVFFFYVPEASDALRHPADKRTFIAERHARHARNLRRRAPEIIGRIPTGAMPGLGSTPSTRVDLLYKVAQDELGVLKGVAASPGTGRGPARLVRGPAELHKVRPGDVLVCRSSNVSYVPAFGKVAAVVTEVGGSLSHAAVVAREFGVPCVVATGVALSELHDGEEVEVDGSAGVVRRVKARVEARS